MLNPAEHEIYPAQMPTMVYISYWQDLWLAFLNITWLFFNFMLSCQSKARKSYIDPGLKRIIAVQLYRLEISSFGSKIIA